MLEYQLKPSLVLLRISYSLYLFSAFILSAYYPLNFISTSLFILIFLMAAQAWRSYSPNLNKSPDNLSLNASTGIIEWQKDGDIRQFSDYSVYTCRWGMILVLRKSQCRKNIILLADRFDNLHQYLDLRFQLIRLNQAINAS